MFQLFFKASLVLLVLLANTFYSKAQTKWQTDTLHVLGNCSMCKKRIEEATYIKGIKSADWNKTTKVLTVVYTPAKTSRTAILQAVLTAGHDASGQLALDKHYKNLPGCCAYRTGTCND